MRIPQEDKVVTKIICVYDDGTIDVYDVASSEIRDVDMAEEMA